MPVSSNHKLNSALNGAQQFTAELFEELRKANEELREARRAALNLMEDAILSKEALRQSEEKYRTLFNSMDEGFYACEVIFDDNNQPIDILYLEENPAAVHIAGMSVVGKTLKQINPAYEDYWYQIWGDVALTGKSRRTEQYTQIDKKWLEFYLSKVGDSESRQVAVVFNDITLRKQTEANQAFLLKLTDALGSISDPIAIEEAIAVQALHYFQCDRCCYCTIEEGSAIIRRDAFRNGLHSIAGTYPLNQFYLFNGVLESGLPFVANDIHTSEVVNEALLSLLLRVDIQSFLNVPVVKAGKVVGVFTLAQSEPRIWNQKEIELAAETAERTWVSVERAKAEEALRASEERLQKVLSIETVGVIYFDLDGRIRDANAAFERMSGFVKDDLLSNNVHLDELTPPEFTKATQKSKEELLTKGQNIPYEKQYIRPDGSRWWGLFAGKRLSEKEYVEFVVDITESKKAEEAISRSEARLRTLADAVPQVIWTNDAEGNANYFNRRWYEYTGLSYKESAGPGWQAVVHPDDACASIEKWNKALVAGETFDTEYRLKSYSGEYRWFIGRNVPLKDKTGKITSWFGSATDINDLKEAQEALSQSEARLRITMESATDYAIITMDPERRIEKWSSGATQIFGYTEAELMGQSADIIFTDEDKKAGAPQGEMETARDTGRAADERWHQRKDGSRFYGSGVMRPIQGNGLTGYVKVMRDMTEQQLFTEELHRLVAEHTVELQRSNEDLRQFAHVASHDLKEPVRKIKTFNTRIIDDFSEVLPGKVKTYLNKIGESTDRMFAMIEGVLSFSKAGSTQQPLERVDLDETIREIVTDLEVLIQRKNAQIISNNLPQLLGYRVLLYQLFYNLILNSLKFAKSDEPSIINVSCEVVQQDEKNYYEIVLADNGIGFQPEYAEMIFGTFTRLHPADEYEGTGIGLALCKRIVDRHKGHIWATGEPNKGATFTIMLPAE